MKIPRKCRRGGFTLMELMVAMAITTIIVTVLVSITSIALDTWNRSRAELRAARQGKAMIDSLTRDFEALVTRRGNDFDWLSAMVPSTLPGTRLTSTNAAELIFFAGSTDRYDGRIGTNADLGGDVSCIAYLLDYKDPLGTAGASQFPTFVLNRLLVNPDQTFQNLLGQQDLRQAFNSGPYRGDLESPENFVCENVFQFSVTFHLEVAGPTNTRTVPVTLRNSGSSLTVTGNGIEANGGNLPLTPQQLASARLRAVEVSITVLSDAGIDQMRVRGFSGSEPSAEFLAKHSYEYSKLIQIPSM